MRRLTVLLAAALLVLALVPIASAATTTATTRHVDGTVKVLEPARAGGPDELRYWLARFEVRTSPDGTKVYFGYMHLYGITPNNNAGAIHEFSVKSVNYYRTPTGPGASLVMEECIIVDAESDPGACLDSNYDVADASPDAFNPQGLSGAATWSVVPGFGNISIYSTSGQNSQ